MSLGDRFGLAGLIVGLFAIAAFYLWPDKKWIGWLCLSAALSLGVIWLWRELQPQIPNFYRNYPVRSTFIVFICGGFLAIVVWLLVMKETLAPHELPANPATIEAPPSSPPPLEKPKISIPTLLIHYEQAALPIPVPPEATAYVFALNPKRQEGIIEVLNRRNVTSWWPEKPRKKDQLPLGDMYICAITNHSDKALLNVSIVFNLSFYSVEPIEASAKDKGAKGSSLTFEAPGGADKSSFAIYWRGKIFAGRTEALVSQHQHIVVIPDIRPHSTEKIYLVSQTVLFARFNFPKLATAIVEGNPEERTVVLIRPATSVISKVPHWTLTPSIYQWPGVTNSGLDLTQP